MPFIRNLNLLAAIALAALCNVSVRAAQSANTPAGGDASTAWSMVKALEADEYATRLQARSVLLSLGRAAIEPLEYAAKSDDAEVRARALETLITLRGRGFLGIQLRQTGADNELLGLPDDSDPQQAMPSVLAISVISFKAYEKMGITRPFAAEAGGLLANDKILAVNDRAIHGCKDLMREVIAIGPGRPAIISVQRGDKIMRVPVVLTRNPFRQSFNAFGQQELEPAPAVDLDAEMDKAVPQKQTRNETQPEPLAQAPEIQQQPANVKIMNVNGQPRVIRFVPAQVAPQPEPAQK